MRTRPAALLWIVLAAWLTFTAAWAAPQRRVALVIGNSTYIDKAQPPPTLAAADAKRVGRTLLQLGFDQVDVRFDLTQAETRQALAGFAVSAGKADTAMIYFSGRGFAKDGQNWLAPVDGDGSASRSNSMDDMVGALDGARGLRMLVIDASPTRPAAAALAGVEVADVLIVYSAKAGSKPSGDSVDGAFASALTKRMMEPGLEVRRLMALVRTDVLRATGGRQEPAVFGTLKGSAFYLSPPTGQDSLAEADKRGWDRARALNTEEAYGEYLRLFPRGQSWIAAAELQAQQRAARIRAGSANYRGRTINLAVDGGGDYATFAAAVAAASNGDRIVLGPGTYKAHAMSLKKSILVMGPAKGKPAIVFTPTGYTIMQGAGDLWMESVTFTSEGDGMLLYGGTTVMKGVTVIALPTPKWATPTAIAIDTTADVSIVDSHIQSSGFAFNLKGGNLSAVASDIQVSADSTSAVFNVNSSGRIVLVGNRIAGPGAVAFMLSSSAGLFVENEFVLTGPRRRGRSLFPLLTQTQPVVVVRNKVSSGGRPATWADCLIATLCPVLLDANTGLAQ